MVDYALDLHTILRRGSFQERIEVIGIAIPGVGREEVLKSSNSIAKHRRARSHRQASIRADALLRSLESQLRDAQKLAEHLATAAVATFTGITIESRRGRTLENPKNRTRSPHYA